MTDRNDDLFAAAREVTPGGVNSPVRAYGSVGGTPRFLASASGARVTDAAGVEYVDLVASWGPALLGHAHPEEQPSKAGAGHEHQGLREEVAAEKAPLGDPVELGLGHQAEHVRRNREIEDEGAEPPDPGLAEKARPPGKEPEEDHRKQRNDGLEDGGQGWVGSERPVWVSPQLETAAIWARALWQARPPGSSPRRIA